MSEPVADEGMAFDETKAVVVKINEAVAGLGYSLTIGPQSGCREGIVEIVARLTRDVDGSPRDFKDVETDIHLDILSRDTLICIAYNAMQGANQKLLNSLLDEV